MTIQALDTAQTLVNRLKAQIAQAKTAILAASKATATGKVKNAKDGTVPAGPVARWELTTHDDHTLLYYMAAGRPILALAESDGDTAAILRSSGVLHRIAPPRDAAQIGQAIALPVLSKSKFLRGRGERHE